LVPAPKPSTPEPQFTSVPKPVVGYVKTDDDTNADNNPSLNLMGLQGPNFPFNNTNLYPNYLIFDGFNFEFWRDYELFAVVID